MLNKDLPQLGLGTIRLGRAWGQHSSSDIPGDTETQTFLELAYTKVGIRLFDTAPSYGNGLSERRLGDWLRGKKNRRRSITIVTKFGENWDTNTQATYTDFSFEKLKESIDFSIERLGSIPDILLLHKTNPKVLSGEEGDLDQAMEYARTKGITRFGVSIADQESAELALSDNRFTVIQFFFNENDRQFQGVIDKVSQERPDMMIMTNRPFDMGNIVTGILDEKTKHERMVNAYSFIVGSLKPLGKRGIVLSGTANINHLLENGGAYNEALRRTR